MLLLYFCGSIFCFLSLSSSSFVLYLGASLSLRLCVDFCATVFLSTLVVVSFCVLLWSYYYLASDSLYRCFLCTVLCFLFSMCGLVLSTDLLSLLVFWDLLGFSSFFLVIFYRSRSALSGGLLTGLTNRVGDCFFLVFFGTNCFVGSSSISLTLFFLVLVALTKSAQVPFSSWLPAAMAAPTPVSALVHSSTLVTAGVYLLYRFVYLPTTILLSIGVITSLISGIAALLEQDVKKIVALSTISQLGVIVSSIGLSCRSLAFLHLNLHACYKALLFLGIGTVIHSVFGSQEHRLLGHLICDTPMVFGVLLFSLFSLSGLAFLSGWVSKEAILNSHYSSTTRNFILIFFYAGLVLTVGYCFRLVLLCSSVSCSQSVSFGGSRVTLVLKASFLPLLLLSIFEGVLLPTYIGLIFSCVD